MTEKTDAWMPLWIGDYLADTMRLTTVQHGAYLLLLMAYWRDQAPLPDDDETLRGITKTDRAEWKRMRPALAAFFRIADGVWRHKRVDAELEAAAVRQDKAKARAEKAAAARWRDASRDPQAYAQGHAQGPPQHMLEECPSPSPSSSSLRSESFGMQASPASPRPPETGDGDAPQQPADLLGDRPPEAAAGPPDCPVQAIVEAYHEILPELPRVERITEARRAAIRQRWREWWAEKRWPDQAAGLAEWQRFFRWIRGSAFLMGRSRPREAGKAPFIADLEWLMKSANHVRVFEGRYHDDAA